MRFESWPSWPLAGLQVGALTVLGGSRMADGTAPRTGPTLTVDATGHRCLVEWERRTMRSNQASSSTDDGASTTRLCRVDYDLSTVRWWRRGVEGGGDVGSVVLCLDTPPQLTSGRRTKSGPGADGKTRHAWGKRGEADDFTGGAARSTPVHMFAFQSRADADAAVAAMVRAMPGMNRVEAPAGSPMMHQIENADVVAFAEAAANTAVRPGWLGKRDRPDGRVLMPPRKRYEFGGDDDPGFDPE